MIQKNSIFPHLDSTSERKRVLAKVYRLLLRLAEEAENKALTTDIAVAMEEHISEAVLVTEKTLDV